MPGPVEGGEHRVAFALAGLARAFGWHLLVGLGADPPNPVRPPASFVLHGLVDERLQALSWLVIGPILVLLRGWRVHDPSDVTRAGEHEPLRAGEMVHDLPHALRRRDMVFAAGLDVGRRLHPVDIDLRPRDRNRAALGELVPLVERLEIVAVPACGQVGRV